MAYKVVVTNDAKENMQEYIESVSYTHLTLPTN